jgi:hypothetical protein
LIQPRCVCGREVDVVSGPRGEPPLHLKVRVTPPRAGPVPERRPIRLAT